MMATKRLPPPLVGGIQQASVVGDETEDDVDDEAEDEEGPVPAAYWVSTGGHVDRAVVDPAQSPYHQSR